MLIIPAGVSPFKDGACASAKDRLAMCRLAFPPPLFEVRDMELVRGGKSYTVDTIRDLRAEFPDDELYLFTGDDMFLTLGDWHESANLLGQVIPVGACRTGDRAKLEEMRRYAQEVLHLEEGRYSISDSEPLEISSTELRAAIDSDTAQAYLEPAVAAYIREKGLYRYPNGDYVRLLKERLSERRFRHSLAVADSARLLAEQYGGDPEKAYTTGLLHDICKDTPPGEQLQYMLGNGLRLTPVELAAPKLYHAMCGALYAARELHITDPDILNAIRYHTTGRAHMTLAEKIVFIADFISADRDYPGVDHMRATCARSLEEGIVEGLAFTVKELADKAKPIHPDTIDAFNEAVMHTARKEEH